jgi:hypothetical protein
MLARGPTGVTAAEAADAVESPRGFVAVTVNVYAVPLVSPVTLAVVPPVVLAVLPPGVAVTVYAVIGEPPSYGAAQVT